VGCVALVVAGCVDRRFIVESNVPDAQVLIDNTPVGAAPSHSSFEYYGYYTFTVIRPGYETITQRVHVTSPWYGYPPIDFLAEIVWPFHIRDTRRYYFELQEMTKTRVDDLVNDADALRQRGYNLPAPAEPAAARINSNPQRQPLPPAAPPDQAVPLPPGAIPVSPGPQPAVPGSFGPPAAGNAAAVPPPAIANTPVTVPSVLPPNSR
jgi:hypothetical protein